MKESYSKWLKSQSMNWGLPILILIFLLRYWFEIFQYFSKNASLLYTKTFSHPFSPNTVETGQIGDTIGGTIGPAIALIASYLTFIAFWIQYRANLQQKNDLEIERFESKFYQMIQIHRDNITEISIGKSTTGRKAFISFYNELKYIYLFVKNFYLKQYLNKQSINDEIIYNISYLIFFFGCGKNSSKIILDIIGTSYKTFYTELEKEIESKKESFRVEPKQEIQVNEDSKEVFKLQIKYLPFNGHMSKLSHYIRHLYQLVWYVEEQYPKKNNYKAKNHYITIMRSQLSTFEQLIIYYNALSVLGKPWLETAEGEREFLLKKYCLIKSLPVSLADFYKKPEEIFGVEEKNINGIPLFEWHEMKARFQNINKI